MKGHECSTRNSGGGRKQPVSLRIGYQVIGDVELIVRIAGIGNGHITNPVAGAVHRTILRKGKSGHVEEVEYVEVLEFIGSWSPRGPCSREVGYRRRLSRNQELQIKCASVRINSKRIRSAWEGTRRRRSPRTVAYLPRS